MFDKKAYKHQWNLDHKEEINKYKKQYRLDHPDYDKECGKQYYQDHKEERDEINKQYYIDHREEIVEYKKQYAQTDKEKQRRKRIDNERRQLGFFPLNKSFMGAEAHHISLNFVIYIPKMIHKSIRHCLWTWENMEQMNKLAIEFL